MTITKSRYSKLKVAIPIKDEVEVQLLKEVMLFHPAQIVLRLEIYEGIFSIQKTEVQLLHPYLNLIISWNRYAKKYDVSCPTVWKIQNKGINVTKDSPNNIGKLNTKKIEDWIAYYEELYKHLKVKNDECEKNIKDFKNSLRGLKAHWLSNERGFIVKGGLEFWFTINRNGYIQQEIKVCRPYDGGLTKFLKMADNKL